MSIPSLSNQPGRIDEPQMADDYAAVFSDVAAAHRPIIVRRNGKDLAAVVPLEHLELISESLAQQEAEKLAAQIDWKRLQRQIARRCRGLRMKRTILSNPREYRQRDRPPPSLPSLNAYF